MAGTIRPKHLNYSDPRAGLMQAGDLFLARRAGEDISIDWTDFPPPSSTIIDPTLRVHSNTFNPPANAINLYARDYTKPLLSNRDEYFHDLALRIRAMGYSTYEWHANNPGVASISDGTAWTITGTQGVLAQSITNKLSRMRRNIFTTAAAVNSSAGIRNTGGASVWRSDGTAGGGFFFFARISCNNVSNTVYSVGVQDSTVLTSLLPTSIFDGIVFGKTSTGNWSIFPRAAGFGTPIVVTTDLTSSICFEISIFAPFNASFVRFRVDRIDTPNVTTLFFDDLTTNLPAANVPLFSEARIVTGDGMVKAFGLGKLFFMAPEA